MKVTTPHTLSVMIILQVQVFVRVGGKSSGSSLQNWISYTYTLILEVKFIFQIKKKKKKKMKKKKRERLVNTYFVNMYADNYLQERRENIGNIFINKKRLKIRWSLNFIGNHEQNFWNLFFWIFVFFFSSGKVVV